MTLSIADRPWRKWALRAIAGFLLVYMLGAFGIPTLVAYVAVVIAVVADALRTAKQSRRDEPASPRWKSERGERIH